MNGLLSPSVKDLEDSKKDPRTRVSDRRRPMDEFTMRSWAILKERKKFWLLPFVITVLLLTLAVWTDEPVVAPSDDVFVLGG
jgi:Family of unknown function (DUF5989)